MACPWGLSLAYTLLCHAHTSYENIGRLVSHLVFRNDHFKGSCCRAESWHDILAEPWTELHRVSGYWENAVECLPKVSKLGLVSIMYFSKSIWSYSNVIMWLFCTGVQSFLLVKSQGEVKVLVALISCSGYFTTENPSLLWLHQIPQVTS